MPRLLIDACLDGLRTRAALVAENVLLRHQLMLLRERGRVRPRFERIDRILWALASRWWTGWQEVLVVVKPATVIGWHRRGFRLLWRWKSRSASPQRALLHGKREKEWCVENRADGDVLAQDLAVALRLFASCPAAGTPYSATASPGVLRLYPA